MLLYTNDQIIAMGFNANVSQSLLSQGYDGMSLDDKNSIVAIIANNDGIAFSDVTPDYILNYHKKIKIDYLDNKCLYAISSGFTSSNGHNYSLDSDAQVNMLGQKIELMDDSTIDTVYWRAEDIGEWISHTRDEWLTTVFKEAFNYKLTTLIKCKQLRIQVTNATSHDDIIAVKWD